MVPDSAQQFAIHEAGHAVAGHYSLLGQMPIVCVTIEPGGDGPGFTRWGSPYTLFESLDPNRATVESAVRDVLNEIKRVRIAGRPVVFECAPLFQAQVARAVAQRLRNYAILLAGHLAQEISDGRDDHDNYGGDAIDTFMIKEQLFGFHSGALADEFSDAARTLADQCLRSRWEAVELLAAALVERRTLCGADAIAIINAATHQPALSS